ncbi:MAG: hypothetical protein RLZZ127_2498 [Planctomycetota bacterium]|jgi:hypothetical protein
MAGFRLLFKRGTDAERRQYVAADGEPIWTSDLKQLWIGDGITAGGVLVVSGGGGGGPTAWDDITGKPGAFPPVAHTHLWADITDKPATFAPAAHQHALSDLAQSGATTGQVPRWNGTAWAAADPPSGGTVAWADITGKPSSFAPSAHAATHGAAGSDPLTLAQSQVTGLVTDLAAKIAATEKAAANGVATLDAGGKIPTSQLPALAVTDTFVVASEAAMLALTAERGDVAVRTDLSKSFILVAEPASTLGNWQELLAAGSASVLSVNGQTGAVTITLAGLGGQPLDGDLTAIAALNTEPYGRSLLTTTSDTDARNLLGAQPLDADLTAIAGQSGTGLLARTAADTWTTRAITGTTGQITVTNGNGVSGAPTISLPSTVTLAITWSAAQSITNATASSSTTTGALVVTGGVGIGGALYAGGAVRFTAGTASTSTATGTLVVTGGVGISGAAFVGGAVSITSTTASTSKTTGALIVSGGVGIAGTVWADFLRMSTASNLNADANSLYISQNATNTSVANRIQTGYAGQIWLNNATGNHYLRAGTTAAASSSITWVETLLWNESQVVIGPSTASTSTTTGALVVTGGLGVGGQVTATGLVVNGGNPNFTRTGAQATYVFVGRDAGQKGLIGFRTGTGLRWEQGVGNGAEGGSNAGSDYETSAYDDAGAYLHTPLQIVRATGQMRMQSVTATTAAVDVVTIIRNNSTGTPATGYGSHFLFQLKSSTTSNRDAVYLTTQWADAADATRKARFIIQPVDSGGAREAARFEADGAAARAGFLGAAAVARQTLPAAATDAATTQALANSIRAALIAFGFCQ